VHSAMPSRFARIDAGVASPDDWFQHVEGGNVGALRQEERPAAEFVHREGQIDRRKTRATVVRVLLLVVVAGVGCAASATEPVRAGKPATHTADWPMYGYSLGRSGFNAAETILTPLSARRLRLKWDRLAAYGTLVTAQPVVADAHVYWGSWDGIEHATRLDGTEQWAANLGESPLPPGCTGGPHSLVGAAAIGPVKIGGRAKTALFVGGGKATFYALNAVSGKVIWQRQLAKPPADIWSSPLVYHGSVYTSTAGFGDCPGAQGQIFQLDAATGRIKHTFDVVPRGCIGGGVWGSVTIDKVTGTLYAATGNDGSCPQAEPYTLAVVKLRASDLAFQASWQVPVKARALDSDFGATPTLFAAKVGGRFRRLVGVANKNGIFYAFDEADIGSGPVWQVQLAASGTSPESGAGSISSAAWDGSTLYVAGGTTTIAGQACQGSVRALDPATGVAVWQSCLHEGFVLGAVAAAPGIVAVGAGKTLVILAASDGGVLARTLDSDGGFNIFYGGAAIANGVVYIGNANGTLLAYAAA
jgi:outer membrane protein assembly factor BamB